MIQTNLFQADAYPNTPGVRAVDTSRAAGSAIASRVASLRRQCLTVLGKRGPSTPDEVAAAMSESVLSIRPRMTELKRMGLVSDTGERRRNDSGRHAAVMAIATTTRALAPRSFQKPES